MFFLRQGATHKVVIGPVVAVANGYVPVTTLTLSGADEAEAILHDNGTVVDISGYTFAAITTADGYYHLTLQSGISGTVGHVTIVINDDSLCLPVKAEFTVVEEAVYDALYAASAPGYVSNAPVNVAQISGDSTAADNAEAFFDGTGYAGTNNVIPTVTTVTNLTNAPGAGDFTATMKTSIGTAVAASAVASVTGNVGGNVAGSVGSVTGAVGSVTGAVGSVTGNVGGSVASVTAGVTVTTNNDKTGYALSATGSAAMTEGYASLGAAATLPQLLYEVRALLAEKSISSTTLTTKKLDGSTTAATYTLDDATTPSAITRAT